MGDSLSVFDVTIIFLLMMSMAVFFTFARMYVWWQQFDRFTCSQCRTEIFWCDTRNRGVPFSEWTKGIELKQEPQSGETQGKCFLCPACGFTEGMLTA